MKTKIVPITKDNLELVAAAGAKFGMPRSVGWLRRCFFDPTVEDLVSDKVRGHISVDENGDVKAIQCYYYHPLYFRQTKILGNTGAIMGAEAKFGEELLCVLDENKKTTEVGALGFGNCIFGKRSAKVNKVVHKMRESPCRPREIRSCVLDWSAFFIAVLRRMHLHSRLLHKMIYITLRPIAWIRSVISSFAERNHEYRIVKQSDFGDCRFEDFWRRFLAANDGIVSSRDPKRLRWLFDDSLQAGTVLLATAEKEGRIDGYVLIREHVGMRRPPRCYDVIDICAVNNDVKCLEALCREAAQMAAQNGGVKLFFSGGMPNQEQWLDCCFNIKSTMENAQFMYGVSKGSLEVKEALEQNKGWFFGPLDGERCLGHGGYIDV